MGVAKRYRKCLFRNSRMHIGLCSGTDHPWRLEVGGVCALQTASCLTSTTSCNDQAVDVFFLTVWAWTRLSIVCTSNTDNAGSLKERGMGLSASLSKILPTVIHIFSSQYITHTAPIFYSQYIHQWYFSVAFFTKTNSYPQLHIVGVLSSVLFLALLFVNTFVKAAGTKYAISNG